MNKKDINLNILKKYYVEINSIDEIKVGDIVLLDKNPSILKKNIPNALQRGIIVKKIKSKGLFNKNKCIIYNINTSHYPDNAMISKIISYYENHEEDILQGNFEFMMKFSKGKAVYLVNNPKNIEKF